MRKAPLSLRPAHEAHLRPESGLQPRVYQPWQGVAARHGRRDYFTRRALAAADVLAVMLAITIAFLISPVRSGLGDVLWMAAFLPMWLLLFRLYGLYDHGVKRVSHTPLDDLPGFFHVFVLGTLLSWVWFRVAPAQPMVLEETLVFGGAGLLLVFLLRREANRLTTRLFGSERVLLVGETSMTQTLVSKMRAHPEYALVPVGMVSADSAPPQIPGVPVLGRLDQLDLPRLVAGHDVDRLIVGSAEFDTEAMLDLLPQCGQLGVKVSIMPRNIDATGPSLEVDDIEGVTVLCLSPLVLSRSSRLFKRCFDIAGSLTGLVIFAPVMALIGVAIKFDSPGPMLFRQERVGRGERRFKLLKFRTMVVDAEERTAELWRLSADPHWLKLDSDPRVTRVGRILRLTSLDELPQLWNVLRGEMSLVGPRPLPPTQDEQIHGWARTRLGLAPGITGLWQVLGRADIPFKEMVKLDYLYVTNWSLWQDVKLVLRTIPVVLGRRGAN